MNSVERKIATAIPMSLAAVALVLSVSACQTTGMADAGGRGMEVSTWKAIDVSKVDLDLPVLLSQKVTKAEYQERDNAVHHNRLQLDGGKGVVFTQYFWDAWYDDRSEQSQGDIEAFKKMVSKMFKENLVSVGEIRAVKRHGVKALGFETIVDIKNPKKRKCFFSDVGYRLKPATVYSNDRGNIDSIIQILYCDPNVTMGGFSRAVENVDVVKDRAAFAAALANK